MMTNGTNLYEANWRKEIKGFGGWLVLFQIWMYVIILLHGLIVFRPALADLNRVAVAALFLLSVTCMVFFYTQRMVFRILFIGLLVSYTAYAAVTAANFIDLMSENGLFIIWGMAITIGLFNSVRVKNTFR